MQEVFFQKFDWNLFLLISFFSLPGFVLGIGGFVRVYWPYIRVHYPKFPKRNVVAGFLFLSILLLVSAISVGILVAPTTNARYVYFMAILNQKNLLQAFLFEFLPALAASIPISLAYLFFYYYAFRPVLSEEIQVKHEKMRNHAGIGVRIFYYGFFGEVLFRWGLQSLLAFLLVSVISSREIAIVLGILGTAAIQSSIHILGFKLIRREFGREIVTRAFIMNFFAAVCYGVLFWKFGIFASMVSHAILHIVWYPLDIFYYRKFPDE